LSIVEDPHYAPLKEYLIAATGLAYYGDRDQYMAELIGRRLSTLGVRDCASYSERLADGEAGSRELDALIAEMTIGETYFFRDRPQFDAIRDVVIPEILDRKQSSKRLRIWSAGCSNGAEPYSLAILLARDLGHRLSGWDVSIFATDINRRYLAQGQAGRFQEWALRATCASVKQECFTKKGQVWAIRPEYTEWTTFAHMNLVESAFPSQFDLILCRNVMIYFAPETIRRLIPQFHDALSDGGWFVAGAAEHNLENFHCFDTVSAPGATVYRKSERVLRAAMSAVPAQMSAFPTEITPADTLPEPATIDDLRLLADRGDWENAVPQCDRLLAQDRLNPAVHFYRALLLEQTARREEAERSLRQAIYLDRNFLLAHYHLGLALAKGNRRRLAARSFANVLRLAGGMRDEQPIENGDGLTVAGLKQVAEMHLRNLEIS
jgi:chemotaxis protein methyltransferase CheR